MESKPADCTADNTSTNTDASTYTYTSGNPTITYVGFVEDILDITGNVSAFQLTAVPEPSTYAMALAGLACGGYSLFRRRRDR